MADRYAQDAVDALVTVLTANLATKLTAVETEAGLSAGDLGSAVDIIGAWKPNDTRSLLVQVFCDSGTNRSDFGPGHSGLAANDVTVAWSYTSNTDSESSEAFMWRWMTAILDCVTEDPTLGGRVVGAKWTDFDRTYSFVDESTTRHVRAIGFEVITCGV